MSIPPKKMVTFKSSDGQSFEVEKSVMVLMSLTIKNMIRDNPTGKIIDIPDVSGEILSIALDYCADAPLIHGKEINAWKAKLAQLDQSTLSNLDKAAQFLALGSLRDLIFYTPKKDGTTGIAVQETRKKTRILNDSLDLSLGKKSTEEQVGDLWKKARVVNDPPEDKAFSIPNVSLELKLGTGSAKEEYSIANDPPKESDSIQKDLPDGDRSFE